MADHRRSSILDLLRGRSKDTAKKADKETSVILERQVSISSHLSKKSDSPKKPSPEKEGKQRKPVERRESSRLQNAAKLLRSLSKTKDVSKSGASPEKDKDKPAASEAPELPDRGHPAYLSEGKGSRKRKNSGKENKDGQGPRGKDRSHSFHGKLDKRERKHAGLERQASADTRHRYKDDIAASPREETVVTGARSILLTEDNLVPIQSSVLSPDLIQDLPSLAARSAVLAPEEKVADDSDYVEADSVACDAGDNVDNGIGPSGHGDIARGPAAGTPDTRLVATRGCSYRDPEVTHGYVRRQSLFPASPAAETPAFSPGDYDPTYASIEEFRPQHQPSFLHSHRTGASLAWSPLNTTGPEDDYTAHLRTSSYAMLKAEAGPQSLAAGLHQPRAFPLSSTTPASLFQSLPYIGAQQLQAGAEDGAELEEYARQYEGTGRGSRAGGAAARGSGRDSVMTVTSGASVSGHSDSSADTLRPSPAPAPASGLPSLSATPVHAHHELRDGAGAVYTKMRPVFAASSASSADGRRNSDFYSFSAARGGYARAGAGSPLSPDTQLTPHGGSVSQRIHQMESLSRGPGPAPAPSTRPRVAAEDEFHISKSVPNLLQSENEAQTGHREGSDGDGAAVDTGEPSFTYLDPEKKLKVTDNTLKLIQKQAVLDYYTRQKKSSSDLTKEARGRGGPEPRGRSCAEDSSCSGEDRDSSRTADSSFEAAAAGPIEGSRRFARSVSQGSLSALSQSGRSEDSLGSASARSAASVSAAAKGSHSSDPLRLPQIPDASYPGDTAAVSDSPVCLRTPSPDLPPPPPPPAEDEAAGGEERLEEDDTPLPPPPRIEEAAEAAEVDSGGGGRGQQTRSSPATLAARGAPGWERFLGLSTASVTFTSDEARKFRRTKDRHRARNQDQAGPKSLPFAFAKDGAKPLQPAKSSPSLHDKLAKDCAKDGAKHWWKTSMDSLRMGGEARGPEARGHQLEVTKEAGAGGSVVSHSHSNSDSGLSSLSGRTSCMSPLSVVSTGSSASSGSSRASLRSASIVSSSTIPLDEDDERETAAVSSLSTVRRNTSCPQYSAVQYSTAQYSAAQYSTSPGPQQDPVTRTAAELGSLAPLPHNIASLFGSEGQHTRLVVQCLKGVFAWEPLEALLQETTPPHCSTAELQDQGALPRPDCPLAAKKNELEAHIRNKISSLKSEEVVLKEKESKNVDVGKFLLSRLQVAAARPQEVDKYRVHVEEADKIVALLLGLASRLARAEIASINLKKNWNEDEEERLKNKREKLADQLGEAKCLQRALERRGGVVTGTLLHYFTQPELEQFNTFMRTKTLLLLQAKMLAERLSFAQQQLDAVSLYKF